jgi:uncharacterized protein (DUF1800 family)
LATKLLKTFVIPNPDEDMIQTVAARVQVHEFDLQPVLRELCSSQMFYDSANRRTLIKSPIDLVVGSLRTLATKVKWPSIVRFLAQMGQDVFQPPSVKGWEGNRLWINSSTVLHRINFATELTSTDRLASLRSDVLSNVEGSNDATVAQQERLLLGGEIDNRLHARLVETYQQFEGNPAQKANATLQLVMSLPEYQLY